MQRALVALFLSVCALCGCANTIPPPAREPTANPTSTTHAPSMANNNMTNLIPKPTSLTVSDGIFILNDQTKILTDSTDTELTRIAHQLAASLESAVGFSIAVGSDSEPKGNITLGLRDDVSLGSEGYVLTVTPDSISISANKPAGIFYGTQTLLQLVPPAPTQQPIAIRAATIRDVPRFAWRGMMLDVARHFFKVEEVKQLIDYLARYKINRLHLHLSDDQGWRIEIKSWEKLATIGGSTEVGDGKGGYYTQAEYQALVEYAAENFMLVIPEIDLPGHTNAALASYPELNCDNTAPEPYTGTQVGFSSLCTDKAITYHFVGDVVRELAAITPAPYIHIGGDEAHSTDKDAYLEFIERVQEIVRTHGKQMIGWEEIAQAKLLPTSIAQHWHTDFAAQAIQQGARVIVSPSTRAYLDMKYDAATKLGQNWAGLIDVEKAYTWDPLTEIEGATENDILGVEAPLWTETIASLDDIEYMTFPRLIGIAEIGWSAREKRNWEEYKTRLATHGARLKALNVNFFASPEVPWD